MVDENAAGVRSVQLAIDILEAIAFSGEGLGVTQIADRLHVTKGSVHRHLLTFVERGYLLQDTSTARYSIGPKGRLLARFSPDVDLLHLADGPMLVLREALGHTVVLSAMTPRGALVLSTRSSNSTIEIGVRPGSELPFHASAQGKVLLAYAPGPFQNRILARTLEQLTPKTITEPDRLEAELTQIFKEGFSTAPEQTMLGINALAAPLFDERDACVGALAIVGSIQFLPEHAKAEEVAHLKATSEQISRKLGYGGHQGREETERPRGRSIKRAGA